MNRRFLAGAAALLGLAMPAAVGVAQAQALAAAPTARVIVKYRAAPASAQAVALGAAQKEQRTQSLSERIGVALTAGEFVSDQSHVVFASGLDSAALAARLAAQADVEYAVADRVVKRHSVPNDPLFAARAYDNPAAPTSGGPPAGQWYLKAPGPAGTAAGTTPSATDAEPAWDITTGNPSVVVAVLDTGIRFDHPDFQRVAAGGNLLPGYDFVSADSDGRFLRANDGDGRDADASDPGDFVSAADLAQPVFSGCDQESSSWHGTQTASLIGARTNNGIGMASVGREVLILPVRVIGKCGGNLSDILAGMRWAAGIHVTGVADNANKARVINLSLGSSGACDAASQDAVSQVVAAGTVVVASAGNEGMAVDSPANCSGAIGVAGVRSDGDKGGISSLGPEVALSAPSANCPAPSSPCQYPILAAYNAGTTTPVAGGIYTDSFIVYQGTSFSSPLVAGAAALMLSVQPTLTPADVRAKLMASARPFPTTGSSVATAACAAPSATAQAYCYCTTSTCGAGLLDVRAAVLAAGGTEARITVITTAPVAQQPVTLSAADSPLAAGHTLATYRWSLTDGGGIVTGFVGATDGATVSVLPSAAGSFSVQLTTTDNLGLVSIATSTVAVSAAAVTAPPPATTAGASSGGGALDARWLLLLSAAVLALRVIAWRERRAAAAVLSARSSRRR